MVFGSNTPRVNSVTVVALIATLSLSSTNGFTSCGISESFVTRVNLNGNHKSRRRNAADQDGARPLSRSGLVRMHMAIGGHHHNSDEVSVLDNVAKVASVAALSFALMLGLHFNPAQAEDELAAKYGGKGFDSSLVDQTCLVDKCSLQAKACLADDPSCRKGLTCTAKCLGDNACITGCMARYGDKNLDNLLKCTIEDNDCIKIAILEGGQDKFGQEPKSIAPTVGTNFNLRAMEGSWYKVVGFNPNYDCYACQKNTFTSASDNNNNNNPSLLFKNPNANQLEVDVEFSMPRMLPDGSPPPPKNLKENVQSGVNGLMYGANSIGFNDYALHETMVFDTPTTSEKIANLALGKGKNQKSYSRTAHSEGEMFGLKFWENWYVIGENEPDQPEFKFVYYNGKTRQNTYEGAFVYSRTKELGPDAMKRVYKIADENGMNPDNFCKIRNGCFKDENLAPNSNSQSDPFRSILASTKISQLLGVEPVAAENTLLRSSAAKSSAILGTAAKPVDAEPSDRPWWYEVGDYLENPNRHFQAMDSLRILMDWPDYVKNQN